MTCQACENEKVGCVIGGVPHTCLQESRMSRYTDEARTIEVVITCRETGKVVDRQFAYGRTDADFLLDQLEDTWGERYIGSLVYDIKAS